MEKMDIIVSAVGTIASIIAAIFGVKAYKYAKKMSRGNIRRQIAAKERQISAINNQLANIYGLNDNGRGRALTALDYKKAKLQAEIEDLRLEL